MGITPFGLPAAIQDTATVFLVPAVCIAIGVIQIKRKHLTNGKVWFIAALAALVCGSAFVSWYDYNLRAELIASGDPVTFEGGAILVVAVPIGNAIPLMAALTVWFFSRRH